MRTELERRLALKRLEADMKHYWAVSFNVPGMENFAKRRHTRILFGGFWFWLIVGSFYLMWYALVFEYVLVVVALRLSIAILVTLGWGLAVGFNRIQTRIDARKSLIR